MPREAVAFAPASVGNVAVGFDVLGHAIGGVGDRVRARRIDAPEVRVKDIRGVVTDLPRDPERNTAARAVMAWREAHGVDFGVELDIDKGIALGSGMGGSAASATAALIAANALLDRPLPRHALYPHALTGESAASGGIHGDNVGPQLIGGLVLATRDRLVPIPVPPGLTAVLVHPPLVLETRRARAALAEPYPIGDIVRQTERLSLVLAGCFKGDFELIAAGLKDVLVEPRRAPLIPGFAAVKAAALAAGALGASISGAGPSVFAWCHDAASAAQTADAMRRAFADALGCALEAIDCYVGPVSSPGARVEQVT
jgi:homoserine kinase